MGSCLSHVRDEETEAQKGHLSQITQAGSGSAGIGILCLAFRCPRANLRETNFSDAQVLAGLLQFYFLLNIIDTLRIL